MSLYFVFFLLCISLYVISKDKLETFKQKYYNNRKLFILQSKNTFMTLTNMDISIVKIGYKFEYEKQLFVFIYNQHNCSNIKLKDVDFVREKSISFSKVNILMYSGEFVPEEYDVKIMDYFKNTIDHPLYEFVVYNHVNMTYMVFGLWKTKTVRDTSQSHLDQQVTYDKRFNFVIENDINGKYFEKKLNTNKIILYQNKLDNLDVKKGDSILFRNQKLDFINGVYNVYKVDKYIHLLQHVDVLPKYNACIDENLVERPEYNNKYSCEHPKDMNGKDKNIRMKWDSRCRRNIECPFFDKDNNYSGQCKNGYCDVPLGYKSISFKHYKKSDIC